MSVLFLRLLITILLPSWGERSCYTDGRVQRGSVGVDDGKNARENGTSDYTGRTVINDGEMRPKTGLSSAEYVTPDSFECCAHTHTTMCNEKQRDSRFACTFYTSTKRRQ